MDEKECLDAELAGLVDAVEDGLHPPNLERITVVEFSSERAARFGTRFGEIFPPPRLPKGGFSRGAAESPSISDARERLGEAGYNSAGKPSIFVAMPFAEDMEDVYYYGIERPVKAAGYLCERSDKEFFTGEVMDQVKTRIERAQMVIAEVTRPNPNVYLEIGYAWGRRKDVLLTANKVEIASTYKDGKLPFDIQGHNCLQYKIIRNLEKSLSGFLAALR